MSVQPRRVAMLDSGLGGLTVLHALRSLAPDVDVVYFADTANVPYGDRSLEEVALLGARIIERLATYAPAAIIIASGTTCAAFDTCGWPASRVPLVGVIEAGAASALRASRRGAIGVIATRGTIDSGCFERALHALAPATSVTNVAAPALVPIVEAGESNSERANAAVLAVCPPFRAARCDAVILGCTHFPHLRAWFAAALGPDVALVDPADECAARCAALLPPIGRSATSEARGNIAQFVCEVSGDEREFARHARMLGAPPMTACTRVSLAPVQTS
jgi:glutamate racemase